MINLVFINKGQDHKCMIDLELKLGIDKKLKCIRKTDLNLSTYYSVYSWPSAFNFNNYDIVNTQSVGVN